MTAVGTPGQPLGVAIGLAILLGACDPSRVATVDPGSGARPAPAATVPALAVGDDRLIPLPDGPTAFSAIRALLLGARTEIEVEMYEFQRADLKRLLVQAERRQVSVTAIMDPSERQSQASWADLAAAGVRVLAFPVEPRSIDHVKLLIVDRRAAIVGGINWGWHSALNRDYDLLAEGPVAANLERVFDQDRTLAGDPVALPPPVPDALVRVVATRPAHDIRDAVLSAIAGARRTIDVEMYVLSDLLVVDALRQAAARGIRVRVLLDPGQPQNLQSMATLRAASVEARLFRAPPGIKLHAKLGIFDHTVVVFGSCNWSRSGFTRNHELDLVIQDAGLASAFGARLDQDWAA
jgi:phosphatidylserine/phosphatidylglycerophosphate/cardiolipin synthase-like enzyme